ncbi:hypothetical protein GEV33_007087 [Tenebrio molitor]|uniref:Secreted protein n=1 Tax=Tenebrio molitor TaxID=7067 RepID=A0A8J6LJ58_TENMO|nr:hypothetical protein GEV33_007087 [Tenebrio molitor]
MFILALTCAVLAQGILGNPLLEAAEVDVAATGRTFSGFRESNWNPVNWFGSSPDKTEDKLKSLYKAIDCLAKNNATDTSKCVNAAKKFFVKMTTPPPED